MGDFATPRGVVCPTWGVCYPWAMGSRESQESRDTMNITGARVFMEMMTDFGGRDMDTQTTIDQIGLGNVLAISGGMRRRWANSLDLPVGYGYHVTITLEANDTYTVRRVLSRGAKVWIKAEAGNVYGEQLGEIAYRASCFRDEDSLPLAV